MKVEKSLHWGSMPWEQDGGAIVNYYLLQAMHKLRPKYKFYCNPRVPEEADPKSLPFAKFLHLHQTQLNDIELQQNISRFMLRYKIPLLNMFHIRETEFPVVNLIKEFAKTIVHQTIHWKTDMIFTSEVFGDIDYWVTPTKWAKEVIKEVGQVKDEKVEYIPHAVNLDKFYPHMTQFRKNMRLEKDQKVILFVGRTSLLKGVHQLIPIMRPLINDYNCRFVIRANVSGEKYDEIGYLFNHMVRRFPKNISFLPHWHPPEFMEELMATPDILVQPSGHEGFDLPLIEAMACKVAIAVTNIPNHWEILGERNRYCGLFMEPTVPTKKVNEDKEMVIVPSSDMIEGSLRFLIENPEECKAMAENGYARAREEYDLNKIANKWFELMDRITNAKS